MITIEKATLSDLDHLTKIDHLPEQALEDSVKCGFVYTAKKDGKTLGLLRYSLFWQTIPFLDLIFLEKEFRCGGIGSRMLEKWEDDMASLGYKSLMTSTQSDESAYLFYEKHGFRKCGSFFPPDQKVEEWIYRKTIKK
jgi:GNAT superfamily N-acetyltransferase